MSDMHINSLVRNWDSLHNSARSLINFFMKGAKIYVHGVYEDGMYTGLSCNVQYKYKVYDYENDPVTPTCYLLNLPLTLYSSGEGDPTYPAVINEASGKLPLIKSPLVRKSSNINFIMYNKDSGGSGSGDGSDSGDGSGSGDGGDTTYLATSLYDIANGNVDLIPMLGDVANTDESIRPSSISSATDHTISVNAISGGNLKVLYQLRTSTFRLSKTGQTDKVAYYKIGIMPFLQDFDVKTGTTNGGSGTVDERLTSIINYLKGCTFYLFGNGSVTELGFKENGFGPDFAVETTLGNYADQTAIPGGIILPILYDDYDDTYIKGIAYLQMFEGTEESSIDYVSGYTVKKSYDGSSWQNQSADDAGFMITDQHMDDGEFVPYESYE